ncbi:hypothetical protein [Halodesulfurarchaeum sp.]|uniref:hypothetical protein n=1 Tax=Halodesulfurarchaeum sp. TaxID=1980530 RepID=UPI002FC317CC
MSESPGTAPLNEYWEWFAVALFVLITVDMITTVFASWYVGPAAEANPLMRWALQQGLLTVTVVNLGAAVIAVGGFALLIQLVKGTNPPWDRYIAFGVETWLGLLIASGLFIFANNLFLIFHGRSLL